MAELSKMKVGTTTYNVKDATARGSLVLATQTKNGLMSAADKKKLDNTPDIVTITLEWPNQIQDDNYNFINSKKEEIAAAADAGKVIYIKWPGFDGDSLNPTTYTYDSGEFIFTIWGDPTAYASDGSHTIAVEYYCDGDLSVDGFTQYRLITATKPEFTNL